MIHYYTYNSIYLTYKKPFEKRETVHKGLVKSKLLTYAIYIYIYIYIYLYTFLNRINTHNEKNVKRLKENCLPMINLNIK